MDKSVSNVQRLPKISLFEPKKKSTKRIAISKRRRRRIIDYSQIDLATDSEKKTPMGAKNVQKRPEVFLFEPKKK